MTVSIKTSFDACRKAFDESLSKPQVEGESEKFHIEDWQDELGRLRMWSGNIGAHQTGQSSLDFRLRDSSHIRVQIIKLLDEIPRILQDVREAVVDEDSEDLESLGESTWESEAQTEIQQPRKSVATNISCLFEMSMLVRKPAQHDLRKEASKAEIAYFEPFDFGHVRNKFPRADDKIISRLDNNPDDMSETVVTNFQHKNVDFDDHISESRLTETFYASTLLSDGSFAVPAPPRASRDGAPFACSYCPFIITIRSTRSWTRHVFDDLQPYLCTEPICATPDKLYTTRQEWLHHLDTAHGDELSRTDMGRRDQGYTCGLCLDHLANGKQYDRHIARHLQELALFVLPSNSEDTDEDDERKSGTGSDSTQDEVVENESGVFDIGAGTVLPKSLEEQATEVNDDQATNTNVEEGEELEGTLKPSGVSYGLEPVTTTAEMTVKSGRGIGGDQQESEPRKKCGCGPIIIYEQQHV